MSLWLTARASMQRHNGAESEQPLPELRLHGLRHTWAILALAEGIDIHIVSERLNHSSTRITREIYTHVTRPCRATPPSAWREGSSAGPPDDPRW
jgi:integrase